MAEQYLKDEPANWYDVYFRLARALHIFSSTHTANPGEALYNSCLSSPTFINDNRWFRNFERIKSIDPVNVYASINNFNTPLDKKVRMINTYFSILGSDDKSLYSDIDFRGCPSPSITRIISFRNHQQQKEIWKVFRQIHGQNREALKNDSFIAILSNKIFDKANKWYGIGIPAFTIFLFWIEPKNFLPLDRNTVRLLLKSGKIKSTPKNFQQYIDLLKQKDSFLYINIARVSYNSDEINLLNPQERKELEEYLNIQNNEKELVKEILKQGTDFRLIAIKPLNNFNPEYLKILDKDKIYYFYNAFTIEDNNIIRYEPTKDTSMYNIEGLNINISAVVGKNGSGKSTIVELLLLAINDLSHEYFNVNNNRDVEFENVEGINIELYFKTSHIYKLTLNNGNKQLFEYKKIEPNVYSNPKKVPMSLSIFEDFFYTICVNYSLYSFNTFELGDWVHALFHKNDAYQAPVVIEPYRFEGNIDINVQEDLLKSRLLSNLLEPEGEESEYSFRKLTEKQKAVVLKLKINEEKTKYLYKIDDKKTKPFQRLKNRFEILKEFLGMLGIEKSINQIKRSRGAVHHAEKYIIKKLVSIARTYTHYEHFLIENSGYLKFPTPDTYFKKILKDKSHITFKLRQAINFLKHQLVSENASVSIDELSRNIEEIKSDYPDENLSTIELIPPSFFNYEIILSDGVQFNRLSSGEKQRIYSINSILYHLKNLDSVAKSNNNLVIYRNINIFLDEIELYFHPEMQRTFVDFIIKSIKQIDFDSILGINFCFVTHSPFILSDIPTSNILFLKETDKKSIPVPLDIRTFGANIHKLLMDGFFMEQTLGGFALNRVRKVLDFHSKVQLAKTITPALIQEFQAQETEFKFTIDNLGEDYMRGVLRNHLDYIKERIKDVG